MRNMSTLIVLFFLLGMGNVEAGSESDKAVERNKLGVELLKQGRMEEGTAEFQKALELDPNNATARLNLAYSYDQQGQIERAVAEYRKAIEQGPGNLLAYNNLGVLYDKMGQYDEAIGEFEKALRIDPSDANALKNLEIAKRNKAIVQEREERIAEARKEVEAYPNNSTALYKLGRLYALYNKKEQAFEWLGKALNQGYDDLDYLRVDPALEGLRDDPRFAGFLQLK